MYNERPQLMGARSGGRQQIYVCSMYLCKYVCLYVMCVCVCVCVYACMYACMHVYVYRPAEEVEEGLAHKLVLGLGLGFLETPDMHAGARRLSAAHGSAIPRSPATIRGLRRPRRRVASRSTIGRRARAAAPWPSHMRRAHAFQPPSRLMRIGRALALHLLAPPFCAALCATLARRNSQHPLPAMSQGEISPRRARERASTLTLVTDAPCIAAMIAVVATPPLPIDSSG